MSTACQVQNGESTDSAALGAKLRILHVLNYYEPAFELGGIVRAVSGACRALVAAGHEVSVFCTDASGKGRLAVPLECCENRQGVAVKYHPLTWRGWPLGRFYYSKALAEACAREAAGFDVAHLSTLWGHSCVAGARACMDAEVPYVVSPHGALQPDQYGSKHWKKRLHLMLLVRRILEGAAAVHALSESEADRLQQFGVKGRIVCIPNGIAIGEFARLPSRAEVEERWPMLRGRRAILFLSRLHRKKGLDQLLPAFAQLRKWHQDAVLVLAGPDEGGLQAANSLIKAQGLEKHVLVTGMLTGRDRLRAFAAGDVFTLPSHAEGFPMAVVEAMACGLPVVITPACNFPEVGEAGAGLIIEPRADELARALGDLMTMSDEQRRAVGARARKLVHSAYTWDAIARKMTTVYRAIRDGRPVPLHPEPCAAATTANVGGGMGG